MGGNFFLAAFADPLIDVGDFIRKNCQNLALNSFYQIL